MSAPLAFLEGLTARLTAAEVSFAVTSGMACVYYGLQQTTKDVDLIVAVEEVDALRGALEATQRELPPWTVRYRPVFLAPLEATYLAHGWTAHLALLTGPDTPEQLLDVFGKAPRVQRLERDPAEPRFASRHVVAQMKRTDRDRDWPVADGLGQQLAAVAPEQALQHVRAPRVLRDLWEGADAAARREASARRPLLTLLEEVGDPDALDAWLRLERLIWETVNQERAACYRVAWKAFWRRWRAEDDHEWPLDAPFAEQHGLLVAVAQRLELPTDPIGEVGREALYQRALERVVVRGAVSPERVARVRPPLDEVLP